MAVSFGSKGRGWKPPRTEDDAINPATQRPYWDENAKVKPGAGLRGVGKKVGSTSLVDTYVAQRKRAGTKGY